ncbi:MAG: ankyrin repeat domain-containing protein [Bryobacteraceae bacterium]|nr:ankyrin repeat domain-containing protein [Bryobacteraceae bacterium]
MFRMTRICWILALSFSARAAEPDLFEAARNNDTGVLKKYLEAKGDPNRRDPKGHPLLTLASYNGSLEAVDLLLKQGAEPDVQDGMGTPLMAASFRGYLAIAKRLLAAGAQVN